MDGLHGESPSIGRVWQHTEVLVDAKDASHPDSGPRIISSDHTRPLIVDAADLKDGAGKEREVEDEGEGETMDRWEAIKLEHTKAKRRMAEYVINTNCLCELRTYILLKGNCVSSGRGNSRTTSAYLHLTN